MKSAEPSIPLAAPPVTLPVSVTSPGQSDVQPTPMVPPVPPMEITAADSPLVSSVAEQSSIEGDSRRLDHGLRKWAACAAIGISLVMYLVGVKVIFATLKAAGAPTPISWHLAVAALAACFTVPTILLLAVLKSTNTTTKHDRADSLHEALGKGLVGLCEKIIKGVEKS
ncbi:hypothetical protein ACSFA2_00650 [Variovorax sp. LT2P21]|uniref:hypothetical protein n=1 Tax=Variovorax sp. LT2P21 TaxID=3443731 RepID=UPI003F45D4AD